MRGGQGSRGQGRGPRLVSSPLLYLRDGVPFLAARVALPASAHTRTVSVDVLVITQGGGIESEPPLGQDVVKVDQWEPVAGGVRHHGSSLTLPAGEASEWWVMARHVPDAVVRFRPRQVEHSAQ